MPCRVKVTTVITGGVKSRIARTDRTLVPNSLYSPIEDEYLRRVKHSQDGGMKNEDFARSVVSQVLYGTAPWRWFWPWKSDYSKYIWEGNRTSPIKIVTGGWLWNGLFDRIFTHMFKLWKLKGTR
jgi:1-acylglycerone phosphate reductase